MRPRIAEGVPQIGLDTDEDPAGRARSTEQLLTRDAIGPGAVARVHPGPPAAPSDPTTLRRRPAAARAPIGLGDRVGGRVGTVAQHHELGPLGLGLVKRSVPVDATLDVGGIAAAQEALVDPEVGEHFRPKL